MNGYTCFKNRIIALAVIVFLGVVFTKCKKDTLELPLGNPSEDIQSSNIHSGAVAADGITTSSYYLENSLPLGYVKDGSKDYTSYIQAAVTKYSNIVFPAFPLQVSDRGITIGSNKTITFQAGSKIVLKPTSNATYNILRIADATNIVLYNPVIEGDRNTHLATDGEAGVGIGIRGSSNVTIYNPNVSNCWGDGIYIGQTGGTVNCKNIVIKNAYLRKNRRDGISIIAVDGLLLDNIYAGYTDGTAPMSGINFEPNNSLCELKNIRINNPVTEYNGATGIQISLKNLVGSSDKNTDFKIVNHIDNKSPRYALKIMCNPVTGTVGKLSGLVDVINPTWNKAGTDIPLYLSSSQLNFKTAVSSPEVMNLLGQVLSYPDTYTLLMKQGGRSPLTVTSENPLETTTSTTSTTTTTIATSTTVSPTVVFAVNAGGSSYTASNGITYAADKSYSKGSVYKTSNAIASTVDDVLYQSERYGNFSYAIPVVNGTYEVVFKASETYHKVSGKRQFDILAENSALVSNLDLYAVSGYSTAYDIVKTVTVADGTLNLDFNTDLDNAKICAFHVIKK